MAHRLGTVVIPAMGVSQRFKDHGYMKHKALIEIDDIPIIKRIANTLPDGWDLRVVIPSELSEAFRAVLGDRVELIALHGPTEGQSQTLLRGVLGLNAAQPVMITNCDLEVNKDIVRFFSQQDRSSVMCHYHPEGPEVYSYVAVGEYEGPGTEAGMINAVAEKKRVGPWAQTGWWRFNKAADIHKALARQIQLNHRHTNGEFYLSGALQIYEPPLFIYPLTPGHGWRDYGTPDAIKQQGLEIVG